MALGLNTLSQAAISALHFVGVYLTEVDATGVVGDIFSVGTAVYPTGVYATGVLGNIFIWDPVPPGPPGDWSPVASGPGGSWSTTGAGSGGNWTPVVT